MGYSNKPKLYQVLIRWFIIVGIVSSALSFGVYMTVSYQADKRLAILNLTNIRNQQNVLIEHWLNERADDIRYLSGMPAVQHGEISNMRVLFENYLKQPDSAFEKIALAAVDGQVLLEIPRDGSAINIKDCDYFQTGMHGEAFTSGITTGIEAKSAEMYVSNPVYREDGQIAGVVFGKLSIKGIENITASFRFENTGEIYMFDAKGNVLTQSRAVLTPNVGRIDTNRSIARISVNTGITDSISKNRDGFIEYPNLQGIKVMSAYAWVPERNWGLVAEIEKGEILGNWYGKVTSIILGFLCIIVLVFYPLARRFAGIIVMPLTKIARKVSVFAENYKSDTLSWSILDTTVYEEIDVLSQSFYRMGEKISQLMEILESQAQYDNLTGLANRHYYFKRSQQILELIQRNKRSCSLIFLDIDKFKKVNDTYGHSVGDEVLVQLGKLLERNIRISDVAGRLGGEEFSIILPDTDIDGAQLLAERLRNRVEDTLLLIGETTLNITVSIGIAVYQGTGIKINMIDVLEDLIKKADTAMYSAKQEGRNKVVVYD